MKNQKQCVICGKLFYATPSSDKVCCSRTCSRILREQHFKDGIYEQSTLRANEAFRAKPELQRGPENLNAKAWKIQSPDGTVYECYNLLDWLRNHADLLDGTPRQAWDGIVKIKYSMQGKRKNSNYQWKGWKLLAWGNDRNEKK